MGQQTMSEDFLWARILLATSEMHGMKIQPKTLTFVVSVAIFNTSVPFSPNSCVRSYVMFYLCSISTPDFQLNVLTLHKVYAVQAGVQAVAHPKFRLRVCSTN